MTLLRAVARPLLASMFVYGGLNALRNTEAVAARAKPVTDRIESLVGSVAPDAPVPIDGPTLVRVNGAVDVAFGVMLGTGRMPRLSALVLASSLVPTTLAGHRYWEESDPTVRGNQQVHFVKNLSMLGGLLMSLLDPDPKKKILPARAKDKVVDAGESVQESLHDTANHVRWEVKRRRR
ncbi:putative membrane protein YphA (DoxX/SURF4 family) [Mumia flava]|uniref:Putative membrane protein YphA (DoxX/SURF4 family) n=1 Tax=Mumia flava TaxID=1348852 RepID=A0A2M9BEW9_9ACTN|nr:DoxX family protein [Mumia flava]PJJ56492.1 putative membrane protein YphA (DoxX/SURF4 family) [Mumia flava]